MQPNSKLGKWIRLAKDRLDGALSIYLLTRAPHIFRFIDLRSTDRVLEIGCGFGQWTIRMAPNVNMIVALDINFSALSQARHVTLLRGQPNTAFIVADAIHLPFANNSFSKVVCIDVIEHITNDHKAADEVARVLDLDGKVVVTTLLESRRYYIKKVVFDEHVREYSVDSLCALFEEAGLKISDSAGFYHRFSTIAREIAEILHSNRVSEIHGLSFLIAIVLAIIARLDFLSKTSPGGLAIVAEKSGQDRDQGDSSDRVV